MSRLVLIRCDGSAEIGMGHLVRCDALAGALSQHHGARVRFVCQPGAVAEDFLKGRGHEPEVLPSFEDESEYGQWMQRLIHEQNADALVLDVRDALPVSAVAAIRREGCLTVTLDDPTDRRLVVDLAFYPPVPQVERFSWTGFTGQLFVGWEWVILPREFADPVRRDALGDQPVILVTMGGSDPKGLTLVALRALERVERDLEGIIVLGPGFRKDGELRDELARSRRSYTVLRAVNSMRDLMLRADLAVAAFGTTAYELAATDTPTILLNSTPDHAESATALVDSGAAVSIGTAACISVERLATEIAQQLHDFPARAATARASGTGLDGRGAERVGRVLMANIEGQKHA